MRAVPKISAESLEQHRAETTDRLIDAYSALVLERGYASVSLADVAAKAGLARTAIYNYFADREALLFAWTHREVQRGLAQLASDMAASQTCSEKLRMFIRSQLKDFAKRHLPPGQEVMQFLRPETYRSFMQHIEPLEAMLRGLLDEGMASGEFVTMDTGAVIPMIMACVGAERGPLTAGYVGIDEAADRVSEFVLRALRPAKAAAKPRPRPKAPAAKKRARR